MVGYDTKYEKEIKMMSEELRNLEHWSIEGLEIIPRNLVMKVIKKWEEW